MAEDTRNDATKRIAANIKKGEPSGIRKLTNVPEVTDLQSAIEHLESKGVDASLLVGMDDRRARVQVDALAGDKGFIYPNYRPLYP